MKWQCAFDNYTNFQEWAFRGHDRGSRDIFGFLDFLLGIRAILQPWLHRLGAGGKTRG